MSDILHTITAAKAVEVERRKKEKPLERIVSGIDLSRKTRSLKKALVDSPTGIIAEFKRRSPSKGWINRDADPTLVVPGYAQAGAAGISILTDREFFGGSLEDLRAARPLVDIPILRKDFIVDEYQIYEAREAGADVILLIAAAISKDDCRRFTAKAHELGLEVLLETHSAEELDYATDDVDIVGVNNRNLGTFVTSVENSLRMAPLMPHGKVIISESGISNPATIRDLRLNAGYRGFLIGETFMKTPDPASSLTRFIKDI